MQNCFRILWQKWIPMPKKLTPILWGKRLYKGTVRILFKLLLWNISVPFPHSPFWYQFPNTAATTRVCVEQQTGNAAATPYSFSPNIKWYESFYIVHPCIHKY
jgi:hypothetical protein